MNTDDRNLSEREPEISDEIPEEIVLDQRTIDFLDDELTVALSQSGSIFCTLPSMCNALGLNMRAQIRRITRTKLLRPGLVYMRLKTPKRGIQRMNCFRIDLIASWLVGAETGNMRPEAAAKIDEYQTKLAPTAMHIFLDVMGISPTNLLPTPAQSSLLAPQMVSSTDAAELRQQYFDLLGVVNLMRESLEAMVGSVGDKLDDALDMMRTILTTQTQQERDIDRLKAKTQGLTTAQKQKITAAIKTIVLDSKKAGRAMNYPQIHGAIQQHFHVNSFADIPEEQFEAVLTFLRQMWREATKGKQAEQESLF